MKKIFLLPLAFLTACQANGEKLNGTAYQYQLNNTPITIAFDKNENRYYGKVVNNYFGTYTTQSNEITFHPAGATMMMGPENEMKAEQEWFGLLSQITHFTKENNALIFTLKNGQVIKLQHTAFSN